ncbi:MAG: 3-oxoacyl-[acyl-carrier-protein] reductase [Bryobacterales bacterium]|nr:3-oxoacyl-[acyl-carrier-protein] reductase [Bryobacteraceae bacterium]MDW8354645.1 3-oxoacyl-[acyl-carrier-protein] reductase [Bryobacterales bacterium]
MPTRTALITGASRGIGKATALRLARAGMNIVATSREIESNEAVREEISRAAPRALFVNMDLASPDSIRAAFARALEQVERIDVLVNNAGITRDGLALRMKPEQWQSVLEVNLSGAFYAIQQVLPGMVRERWGRIINITSVVGQMGNAAQANYVSAKAGLIGLTKALARELARWNITVNAVAPGFIETDMTAGLPQQIKDRMLAAIALERFGKPEDVAGAVAFLASEEAGYITGHVLNVNGGMYM